MKNLTDRTGLIAIRINPKYCRPAKVQTLLGGPAYAKEQLGWTPTTTSEELVMEKIEADHLEARKIKAITDQGFKNFTSRERI